MELNAKKLALAAVEAAAIAYAVCAAAVLVAPTFSQKLLGWITHVRAEQITPRTVTLDGFALGLVEIVVYVYLFAWLLAWLYNKATPRQ